MASIVVLDELKLRQLARLIYLQEAQNTQNIQFKSENELATFLRECKANYDSVISLLDAALELKTQFGNSGDSNLASIANDIYTYVGHAVNSALQTVPNYTLRKSYLEKISNHSTSLSSSLKELDPKNTNSVVLFAKEAAEYVDNMLDYTKKFRSAASDGFSKWVKDTGVSFPDLVTTYQKKLNIQGQFKDLPDSEKLKVYDSISEASGRGKIIKGDKLLDTFSKATGTVVFLFTAGLMVWDIYSAQNVLQEAARQAVSTVASIGGAALGEVVGAALATNLVGAQASTLFVVAAGILGGIAGAFLIGAFTALMIDLIFGSAGTVPLSTEGHQTYVAPMPDGIALAYQLSHQN